MILVSGALGDVKAVECIKQGATDYVLKDSLTRLPTSVRRALQEKELRRQRKKAEQDLSQKVEELARSNADLEQFAYVASHLSLIHISSLISFRFIWRRWSLMFHVEHLPDLRLCLCEYFPLNHALI